MSAPRFSLRDAGPADYAAVLALNNSAVPAVNGLGMRELERIVALCAYFRVVRDAGGDAGGDAGMVAGFCMCIPSGTDYWSENYRWFSDRYDSFLYLDRVVIAEGMRGRGLGEMLYADMHAFAATRWPVVTLEVNLRPSNPGSDRFHQRLGYGAVGVREYDAGAHAVTMYVRAVP